MVLRRCSLVTAIAYGPLLGASVLASFGVVHDLTWSMLFPVALAFSWPAVWIWFCARPGQHVGGSFLLGLAMLVLAFSPVHWVSDQLVRVGCRLAAARMQPLANAIERCWAETGKLPLDLTDLVPNYLVALPARVPRPYLLTGAPGEPWSLVATFRLTISRGYDVIYRPDGKNPEHSRSEAIDERWSLFRF